MGFETEAVCADGEYDNSEVYDAMLKRNIRTYIPRRKKPASGANYTEEFNTDKFIYDKDKNIYICFAGKELCFSTYSKKNRIERYTAITNRIVYSKNTALESQKIIAP